MANINVINLGGKKVGEFELADEVSQARSTTGCSGSRSSTTAPRSVREPPPPRAATRSQELARSSGSRRELAALVSDLFVRLSGEAAERFMDRSPQLRVRLPAKRS